MSGFDGFQSHPERSVNVPDVFFTDVLPSVHSAVELKVTLHLMWILSQRVGRPRCIEYSDLAAGKALLESLKIEDGPRPAEDFLREGLELAVTRGTVLQLQLKRHDQWQFWYFLNSPTSRSWISSLQQGETAVATDVVGPGPINEARTYRPNVFALYEQNIGPLTPIIAERLRVAEADYPALWLEEAIRMSVEYNKRNWRYVEAILRRWQSEGKDDGTHRRSAEEDSDPYGYFRSKYQHLYR